MPFSTSKITTITGATGATGPTGPAGADGADGADGATGATGTVDVDTSYTWTAAQIPSTLTDDFSDLTTGILDFDEYQNFVLTLDASTNEFGVPTTDAGNTGQTGVIVLIQDGTGNRTATWTSNYKPVGGAAPTLSTAANAVDILPYCIQADNTILIGAPQLDFKATS